MNRIPREDLPDVLTIVNSFEFRAFMRWLKQTYKDKMDDLISTDDYEQQLIIIGECRQLRDFIRNIKQLKQ